MNIKTALDDFVSTVRASGDFDDIKIIGAYPFTVKPTALKSSLIAVGFSDIAFEDCYIGENDCAGDVKIFADIFVPVEKSGGEAHTIFVKLCKALAGMNIISVAAQRVCVDEKAAAYVMKTEFTFRGKIDFGGDGGE